MITLNKEYKIERLDFSRLKDLETLNKAVYGYTLPKNYFQKKYDTDYTGTSYVGYIAYNKENIPVAYYGVIPCFIQYKNEIILSAQSGDTMTHPMYRYKGMFVELSKMTFDLCKDAGIKIVFGFPNQNSYHGAIHKLGWIMTEQFESFIIPVNTFPLNSYLQKFKLTKYIYKQYTKWILRKYFVTHQGLEGSIVKEGFGGVCRSKEYLRYKTYSDTEVIKIGAAKAWIKITNHLVIGDLETQDFDFEKTIDTIKKISRYLGITKIMFQSSGGTRLHNLFAQKFKSSPSFPVLFQNFGTHIPLNEIKFTFADIDIF